MEALSDVNRFITRGVQRRVEAMVAAEVESKLDNYCPDGASMTDALKMRIALYIAKGLVAPYFSKEDVEELASEAEEEARKKKEKEQEGSLWSLFDWDGDDDEVEEPVKEEKKNAESFLTSFFSGKSEEKTEEAKAEAKKIATVVYANKKAQAEGDQALKEEDEENSVLEIIQNYFTS